MSPSQATGVKVSGTKRREKCIGGAGCSLGTEPSELGLLIHSSGELIAG